MSTSGLPQNPYRWRVAMARIKQAQGDREGALALLEEAERRYVGDFFPNVRPVAALVARVWVAQGRLGDALGWARAQGLSAQDDLSYLREFETSPWPGCCWPAQRASVPPTPCVRYSDSWGASSKRRKQASGREA